MPILSLFPYESFYIKSKLDPEVLQARLQLEITFNDKNFDKNADRFFDPDTHFLGFAGKHKFSIKPYVNYNSWLLPKIKGAMEPDNGGSIVSVEMKLPAASTIVITICMAIIAIACGAVIVLASRIITYKGLSNYINTFNFITLIPFVLLVLGHILTIGAFKQESSKSRNILLEMFEGELFEKL